MTLITFFDYLDQIAAEDVNFCLAVRYMEPNGDTYDTSVSYVNESDYYRWGNMTGPSDEAEIQLWCPVSKLMDKFMGDTDALIIKNLTAPTVEITEKQAIDKLHETGWLIRHDKEMTERPQGEYVDISKLRLMTVEECAGHTIDYAMGWKACIEWIKKGGAE